jgi:hypothetical protein
MYLSISFVQIPEFDKRTNLYAYYIDKSDGDEPNDNFYALVTDKKPINDIEICSKIPNDIIDYLKDYFFVISSKDGYDSSREDVVILNSIFSHHIEEFENDITNYISVDFKESFQKLISTKKIYYNYSFDFSKMTINSGKLNNIDNFVSNYLVNFY